MAGQVECQAVAGGVSPWGVGMESELAPRRGFRFRAVLMCTAAVLALKSGVSTTSSS